MPETITIPKPRSKRVKASKPTCGSCYFGVRMLCALDLGGPCSTFRPDSPAGLVPPQQPMLLVDAATSTATLSPELAAA